MKHLPRVLLPVLASFATFIPLRATERDERFTFVIVHGATAGGWEWKATAKVLTDAGHTVYRPTLTGLGERHHLAHADVTLTTHVDDVVNLILFEDLQGVILAGHSYGGAVVTGVMDRMPDRIRHAVFLDAMAPDDGESVLDLMGELPPGSKVVDGLVQFPWFKPTSPLPRGVPHPLKTFSEAVSYKNPAAKALPVTYAAFIPSGQTREERSAKDKGWQRAVARGWTIRTLTGTHIAHRTQPKEVAALLEKAVHDKNQPLAQPTVGAR